ncbi:MAG: hypothetical protein L3J88_03650 [Gammaproteobacteria bacterium]|nr:hypothetical protein [Gammaproteobacteria bacterium]MCF6362444.1 hypothetical protein [Gammaproteobacteria bacterium]
MRKLKEATIRNFSAFLIMALLLSPQIASSDERPSVMFMIAEQNIGQEIVVYWWGLFSSKLDIKAQRFDLSIGETILKEEFLNEGFDVIDISNVSDKITVSEAYKVSDLTRAVAIEIGKDVGADVVIKGKVLAKRGPTNTDSNVGTYMADITATAFQVKDGLVLGSGRANGVSRHISEVTGGSLAIEKASQKLARKMIEQINRKIGQ